MRGWGWRKQGKNWDQEEMGMHQGEVGTILHHDPIPEHTGLAGE